VSSTQLSETIGTPTALFRDDVRSKISVHVLYRITGYWL